MTIRLALPVYLLQPSALPMLVRVRLKAIAVFTARIIPPIVLQMIVLPVPQIHLFVLNVLAVTLLTLVVAVLTIGFLIMTLIITSLVLAMFCAQQIQTMQVRTFVMAQLPVIVSLDVHPGPL